MPKKKNELPDDFLIKPFLISNRAEVKLMCITEYDEERTRNELYEDAYNESYKKIAFTMLKDIVNVKINLTFTIIYLFL